MAHSRSLKGSHWPGILDSSHALRKYFGHQSAKSSPRAEIQARLPTFAPPIFVGAEPRLRPRVNAAWQLASDPSDLSDVRGPKRVKGLRDRERKKLERKIWARPAKVDATQKVAGPAKPEKPERLEQAALPPKSVIRRITTSLRRKRPAQSLPHFRSPLRKNILVVDAKRTPGMDRQGHLAGGADQPPTGSASGRKREGQHPKLKMSGRSKKTYGVPLCSRPTEIMGMGLPYSRQMQMRQEKLYQQPEYHDQYMRMLHQQQRQAELSHQQQHQEQQQHSAKMAQHPYSILPGVLSEEQQQSYVYSVPSKSPLKQLRDGKRMCGNFYYD
uniref:Uncharacterized protein LOC108049616 n=1 Tax=Drosophila rhopaloa TaxID=1041015 RepID=A0A6P4FM82_DRORH